LSAALWCLVTAREKRRAVPTIAVILLTTAAPLVLMLIQYAWISGAGNLYRHFLEAAARRSFAAEFSAARIVDHYRRAYHPLVPAIFILGGG